MYINPFNYITNYFTVLASPPFVSKGTTKMTTTTLTTKSTPKMIDQLNQAGTFVDFFRIFHLPI